MPSIPPVTDRLGTSRPMEVIGEAVEGLKEIFKDEKTIAERKKRVDAIIRNVPGVDYPEKIMRALFAYWAPTYDVHMKIHETSIGHLLKMANAIQPLMRYPIIRGKTLEMSCGTGAVIDMICRIMSPDQVRQMSFIANDLSPEMQKLAHKKLQQTIDRIAPENRESFLTYSYEDIRSIECEENEPGLQETNGSYRIGHDLFDLEVLAQTLHLIIDPALIKKEESGDYSGGREHIGIKIKALRSAFELLRENGHLVIIDEWPEVLSSDTDPLLADLFHRTMRPIESRQKLKRQMSHITGARFVSELKANIDFKHSMYMLVYRKDPDKMACRGKYCDESPAKKMAAERAIELLTITDRHFTDSFSPPALGWTELIPLRDVEPKIYTEVTSVFEPSEMIIMQQILHDIPDGIREEMIKKAVQAVKKGGAIMFLDEWQPSNAKKRLSRTYFRDFLQANFEGDLIFQSAHREPIKEGTDNGMTAFLYRKKS